MQIKFSKCPIDPHKGESRDKLKAKNRHPGWKFTTLRGWTASKSTHYNNSVGTNVEIVEEGVPLGKALITGLAIEDINTLSDSTIRKDTFHNLEKPAVFMRRLLKHFYRNDVPLIEIRLQWTEVYP